jgi:hypothetical protein
MGKYKKPKRQTENKPANIMTNEKSSVVIYVDGRFHTNLAIKKIVEETIQDYRQKLSENKWIQSQKQKQHLIDYHFYSGSQDPVEICLSNTNNSLNETEVIDKVSDSFFKKLFNRIKNAINM